MDRDTYNDEVDKIAAEIHDLSLERHRLYEREKTLLKRLVEVRRQRESAARRERSPSPEEFNRAGRRQRALSSEECKRRKVDRFGNKLKVGDRVELITPGRCVGINWTIYKLTDKRVLCERNEGVFKTHREYRNVKKL